MFVTKTLNVNQIFRWFDSTTYNYLMLFLPSFNPQDRKIEDYVIDNQMSIDRLTGDMIAYISYDKDIDDSRLNSLFYHIDECRLKKEQIKTGIALSEQICDFYSIEQFELPALILISKNREYSLYPISSESDMDTYMLPLKTLNSYIKDASALERRRNATKDFPRQLANAQKSLTEITKKIKEYELAKEILSKENSIVDRINENYHILLNECKKHSFVQKSLDELLALPLENEKVTSKFLEIGIESHVIDKGIELISDLKSIPNYKRFQSHLGSIRNQVELLLESFPSELEDLYEKLELYEAEIEDYQDKCDRLKIILENLDNKYQVMFDTYAKDLNRNLIIEDGKEILLAAAESKSYDVPAILDLVSNKRKRANLMLEEIRRKTKEKSYDVFISCKSEDYDKAQSVYLYLEQIGHHPFIANISLREIGMDNYGPIIRHIIGTCKSMIVFATKLDYLTTSYVYAEWNQFLDELSSGYNKGNIISILPPDINTSELPDGLRTKQYLTLDNYSDSIASYL